MESDGEPTQSVCVTCCCMTHIVCIQYGQMVTEWSWPPQVAHTHTVAVHIQEKEMFILIRYIIIDYFYNKYYDKCKCRGVGGVTSCLVCCGTLWLFNEPEGATPHCEPHITQTPVTIDRIHMK